VIAFSDWYMSDAVRDEVGDCANSTRTPLRLRAKGVRYIAVPQPTLPDLSRLNRSDRRVMESIARRNNIKLWNSKA
jgi:hypothetical protein